MFDAVAYGGLKPLPAGAAAGRAARDQTRLRRLPHHSFTRSTQRKARTMHPQLTHFLKHLAGVVCATLVFVLALSFLSIPYTLGGHPGDPRSPSTGADTHMT